MTTVEERRLVWHLLLLLLHASHHTKIVVVVLRLWLENLRLRLKPATSASEARLLLLGLHRLRLLHERVHLAHLLLSDILLLLLLGLSLHPERTQVWLETTAG